VTRFSKIQKIVFKRLYSSKNTHIQLKFICYKNCKLFILTFQFLDEKNEKDSISKNNNKQHNTARWSELMLTCGRPTRQVSTAEHALGVFSICLQWVHQQWLVVVGFYQCGRCLKASVWRAIWLGEYTADDPTPSQLAADMDDNLFADILNNPHHVLHKFLPDKTDHTNNLRSHRHSLSLSLSH